jgi:hypothetical protein
MAKFQTLGGIQNPNTWSQGIKREIAVYGTHIEWEITGIDWGKVLSERVVGKLIGRKERYMMTEDDMSFMEDVFMERKLPFPEYLVSCGYHPMTQEILNKTEDVVIQATYNPESTHDGEVKSSALLDMMRKYGKHFSAKYEIPTVGGATFNVSVICGKMFYSRIDAPYEVKGRRLHEDEDGDDPMGYQTDEQLIIYLAKLIAMAQEY